MKIDMKEVHKLADKSREVHPKKIATLVILAVGSDGEILGAAYGSGYSVRPAKDKYTVKRVMGIGESVRKGFVNGTVQNLAYKADDGWLIGGFKAELVWSEGASTSPRDEPEDAFADLA